MTKPEPWSWWRHKREGYTVRVARLSVPAREVDLKVKDAGEWRDGVAYVRLDLSDDALVCPTGEFLDTFQPHQEPER